MTAQEKFNAAMQSILNAEQAHNTAKETEVAARTAYNDAMRLALWAYAELPNAFKKGDKVKIPSDPKNTYVVLSIQMYQTSHGLVANVSKWMPQQNRGSKTHFRSISVSELQRA